MEFQGEHPLVNDTAAEFETRTTLGDFQKWANEHGWLQLYDRKQGDYQEITWLSSVGRKVTIVIDGKYVKELIVRAPRPLKN